MDLKMNCSRLALLTAFASLAACDVPPDEEATSEQTADLAEGVHGDDDLVAAQAVQTANRVWRVKHPFTVSRDDKPDAKDVWLPNYEGKKCQKPGKQLSAYYSTYITQDFGSCSGRYFAGTQGWQNCPSGTTVQRFRCPAGCSYSPTVDFFVLEGDIVCR